MRADVFWAWTAEGRAAVHERARVHRLPNGLGVDVDLRIPKPRQGSFFPALLQPRRRIDRALWAIVMEAYVHGVSTRKVNDLVAALASTPASARARSAASAPSSRRSSASDGSRVRSSCNRRRRSECSIGSPRTSLIAKCRRSE